MKIFSFSIVTALVEYFGVRQLIQHFAVDSYQFRILSVNVHDGWSRAKTRAVNCILIFVAGMEREFACAREGETACFNNL